MTRCAEADSVVTMKIPPSNYTIRQALPDCSYTIEITSPTRLAACQVNTPDGQSMNTVNVAISSGIPACLQSVH